MRSIGVWYDRAKSREFGEDLMTLLVPHLFHLLVSFFGKNSINSAVRSKSAWFEEKSESWLLRFGLRLEREEKDLLLVRKKWQILTVNGR